MVLTLRSWFGEVGISFDISFKVHKLIRRLLIENIMQPYGLESREPKRFIGLTATTTKHTKSIEVRGPDYDKRNNFLNYGLWLPYDEINNAENYLERYLDCYFDALVILFDLFQVPASAIRTVEVLVKKEVLNNAEYDYTED